MRRESYWFDTGPSVLDVAHPSLYSPPACPVIRTSGLPALPVIAPQLEIQMISKQCHEIEMITGSVPRHQWCQTVQPVALLLLGPEVGQALSDTILYRTASEVTPVTKQTVVAAQSHFSLGVCCVEMKLRCRGHSGAGQMARGEVVCAWTHLLLEPLPNFGKVLRA